MPRISPKRFFERDIKNLLTIDIIHRVLQDIEEEDRAYWRLVDLDIDEGFELTESEATEEERQLEEALGSNDGVDLIMVELEKALRIRRAKDFFGEELRDFLERMIVFLPLARYMALRLPLPLPHQQDKQLHWLLHVIEEDRFKSFFRMRKYAFVRIYERISDYLVFQNTLSSKQAHPAMQLVIFLYRIGGGDTTQHASSFFCIGKGTVPLYFRRLLSVICSLTDEEIQWPRERQMAKVQSDISEQTEGRFERYCGFLNGLIIRLKYRPSFKAKAYYTGRKKMYEYNAIVVYNLDRRFTYASLGHCASIHDTRAFRSTQLCQDPASFSPPGQAYLLADKEYRLSYRVVVSYKAPIRSKRCHRFNNSLSEIRVRIEQALGILKSR